jgi:hypothetical protein
VACPAEALRRLDPALDRFEHLLGVPLADRVNDLGALLAAYILREWISVARH